MLALLLTTLLVLPWSPEGVIEDYVKQNYPWPEVRIQSIGEHAQLPEEAPESVTAVNRLPGRSAFIMKFPSGATYTYYANVEAFDYAVSSRRAMRKGDVFEKDDLYATLVNVRTIPKGAILKAEEAVGKAARFSLPPNRPLSSKFIEEPVVVKRGQEVVVTYSRGFVKMRAKGIAKEDGSLGETIKVQNPSSKKMVQAVIVDGQTVTVGN